VKLFLIKRSTLSGTGLETLRKTVVSLTSSSYEASFLKKTKNREGMSIRRIADKTVPL
jgi:hypothetical protein